MKKASYLSSHDPRNECWISVTVIRWYTSSAEVCLRYFEGCALKVSWDVIMRFSWLLASKHPQDQHPGWKCTLASICLSCVLPPSRVCFIHTMATTSLMFTVSILYIFTFYLWLILIVRSICVLQLCCKHWISKYQICTPRESGA